MKIHGQGQPPAAGAQNAGGPDGTVGPDKPTESGRAFAEKLGENQAASAAAGGPLIAGGVPVGDLAAAVRAGNLTSRAAVDQLVERIVARQVGPQAPAAVREQLKAALEDALENDPLLAEKLRQLG